MLFNSYEFILFFLPIVLLVYFALRTLCHVQVAVGWLVASSLFFYGWWNPSYLMLLCPSMLINFQLGRLIGKSHFSLRKPLLVLGLAFNLGLIGYFKYANFFSNSVNAIFSTGWNLDAIILPLAISFFSFQQIAYLVDAYQHESHEQSFLNYALFVTFFPQLIAGPIVHHGEMLPQFGNVSAFKFDHACFAQGFTVFQFGLFKKVVLADSIATYATPVFSAADRGEAVSFFEAWGGVLAYTFQLYYDFSGYSDMAIGIALMFGIYLPINFNSPYKAVNIIDFWRRWHITLSRFLRDYVYIALLGGNGRGKARRYTNLMMTMLLGGLWHGAGWTFVIWGAVHGCYIMINHAWLALRAALGQNLKSSSWSGRLAARGTTFLAVVFAWVLFRAETLEGATNLVKGMTGMNGAVLDTRFSSHLYFFKDLITFQGKHAGTFNLWGTPWLLFLGATTWVIPNTQQIVGYTGALLPTMEILPASSEGRAFWLSWKPNLGWAIVTYCLTLWSVQNMSCLSEFLYFQF